MTDLLTILAATVLLAGSGPQNHPDTTICICRQCRCKDAPCIVIQENDRARISDGQTKRQITETRLEAAPTMQEAAPKKQEATPKVQETSAKRNATSSPKNVTVPGRRQEVSEKQPEQKNQPEKESACSPEPVQYTTMVVQRVIQPSKKEVSTGRTPVIAIGTNALYDVLLMPDINLEVPVGDRWSFYLDHVFPWWVTRNNAYALQIFRPEAGARIWLGDRRRNPVLSGWYAGAGIGGGYGDLEPGGKGRQWEGFNISACGGYSFDVGKGWRIGLGASAGFLFSHYTRYSGYRNNSILIKTSEGRSLWFGPTGASIEVQKIIFKRHKDK